MSGSIQDKPLWQDHVRRPIGRASQQALWWSQLVVLLVGLRFVPVWLGGLAGAVWLLYGLRFMQRLVWPDRIWRLLQLLVFFGGVAGLWATFRTLLGMDAGVAFLLLCLAAKWFELKQHRDHDVALNLSLFTLASMLLFDQTLTNAVPVLLAVGVVLWAMSRQLLSDNAQALRALTTTVVLAIPLMVVLFLFMPRIPPLWSVQVAGTQAKTGMSDQIEPGDVAQLSQSSELAFRVVVTQGQLPARSELYWRGLVMSEFDGQRWQVSRDWRAIGYHVPELTSVPDWLQNAVSSTQPVLRYQLQMQRTGRPWLFTLMVPYSVDRSVQVNRGLLLQNQAPLDFAKTFEVMQLPGALQRQPITAWERRLNVALPADRNPQSQQFARTLWQRVGQDPQRYSQAVLAWIGQQDFYYTLEPPRLSGERIDQFLFETRRGFCEHYASAYAFLMRAAGVPARLVGGYQGGQRGQDGQSWEVRQMDAHAWVEVWFEGRGWVRVDPTAAIAPQRIEQGMSALTQQQPEIFGEGTAAALRAQQFRWMAQARQWADYVGYVWQRDVVGFDQESQQGWLSRLGIHSVLRQVALMATLLVLGVGLGLSWLWWRRRPVWHPLDRPVLRLSRQLQPYGLQRQPEETVRHWMQRLTEMEPQWQEAARQVTVGYEQARYAPEDPSREPLQRQQLQQATTLLRAQVRRFAGKKSTMPKKSAESTNDVAKR